MKKLFFVTSLIIAFLTVSFGQTNLDRSKAETSVKNYMAAKSKNYSPLKFGEFFNQYYSHSLQNIAKTSDTIKYSIVHTYMLKNRKIIDTYFHLNSSYSVIGMNTMDEMNKLVNDDLKKNPKFDSILQSIEFDMKNN